MKLWRCWNKKCSDYDDGRLGHDFFNEVPICDKCGTDGRVKPFHNAIVKLEITHFNLPTHVPGIHHGKVACDPNGKWKKVVTNHPNVVTCPNCKNTPEWKKAKEEYDNEREEVEVDGHKDFPVEVDLKEQMYRRIEEITASKPSA